MTKFLLIFFSCCSLSIFAAQKTPYLPQTCGYSREEGWRLYKEAFQKAFEFTTKNQIHGDIAEFGTLYGFTAEVLTTLMKEYHNFVNIHLFDSFEGLPEITSEIDQNCYEVKHQKAWLSGSMAVSADVPNLIMGRLSSIIPAQLIHIHKGFFQDTFREETLRNKLAIVHIDCDLYQSAKETLTKLFDFDLIQDGTIILFDDYNCSRANPNFGERRAFKEVMDEHKNYEFSLFYYYGWHGAAVIIHKLYD